jgi:hypothetical protein
MKALLVGALVAAGMMSGAPAIAAQFSIIGAPTGIDPTSLPSNFGRLRDVNGVFSLATRSLPIFGPLFNDDGRLNTSAPVETFDSGNILGQGLAVTSARQIKATYLGFEAKNANTADATIALDAGTAFNTTTSVLGDTFRFTVAAGTPPLLVPLIFDTTGPGGNTRTAINGVSIDGGLLLAFSEIFNRSRSVIAMFGDIDADRDIDDIVVRLDVVPLPAAVWMLLAAIGGLGLVGRRRTT